VIPWDNDGMNTESQQLLQSALALPESDHAEIAASLIHSLDSDIDNNIDEAWAQKIKQRIESIDKGQVKLIPWDDVMLEMGARRHG
jgi:putative addiction module component (TIGR02574 family)